MLNHFDTSGTALFGDGGIAIARCQINNYGEPQIASDGVGGCFVVWTQGPVNNWGPMFLQRINYTGELLWPENKQLICRAGSAYPPYDGLQILADTSFGIIAVCVGYHGILGQRIDYQGNLLWDSMGVFMANPLPNPSNPVLPKLAISNRNFYCTWADTRYSNNGSEIYLQRFDLNGYIYFDSTALEVCTEGGNGAWNQRQSLQIVPDGNNGVVVGWKYNDYSIAALKAQRISSVGNPYWQLNGVQILPFSGSLGLYPFGQRYLAITIDHVGGHYEIFDNDGNLEYGGQGRIFGQNIIYAAAFQNNTLYFLRRIPNQWYYYGSKGDTLNQEYWPNLPFVHEGVDHGYQVLPDGLGGLYAVLSDYRDWNTDWVILQRIYPDGHIGGDTTGINIEEPPSLPKALSLEAYPNPFNSSTSIGYDLPKASDIMLAVFDVLGRKVATLVDGHQTAGHHELIWNAGAYSSGVYFAKATSQNNSSVIKLIYLK